MPTTNELSPSQFREAVKLSEQIDTLKQRLQSILGGTRAGKSVASKQKTAKGRPGGKRTMSPEGRARIAAAARARWARVRGKSAPAKTTAKATPKKKGGLTPEGRARLAAAMKARWAARKKGAPAPNASAS